MLPYVTIRKFAAESGYTEEAIRAKIKAGIWLQDKVWVKAPDGRILIIVEGYHDWVEGQELRQEQEKKPTRGKVKSPPPLR